MLTGEGRPVIVPLGGFLGAGKTTPILAASCVLHARGMRAAAILNDQLAKLVDTQFIEENGVFADQVMGGMVQLPARRTPGYSAIPIDVRWPVPG